VKLVYQVGIIKKILPCTIIIRCHFATSINFE